MRRKRRSVLVVDWEQKRGSQMISVDTQGERLPDAIKTMLVEQLLSDLRGKVAVEVRPL